jgi:hypothetical protein
LASAGLALIDALSNGQRRPRRQTNSSRFLHEDCEE